MVVPTSSPPAPKQPAGKQPMLRPKSTGGPVSAPVTFGKKTSRYPVPEHTHATTKSKKGSKAADTTSHYIMTRARSKKFRFFDLPAEIRNRIYGYAASSSSKEQPLSLEVLALPLYISPSRQFREECLPVFFAVNTFKASIVCNYCVYQLHFHGPQHLRLNETGKLHLPPFLAAGGNGVSETMRLQHVHLSINCVCCFRGNEIATMDLRVEGKKPVVEGKVKSRFQPDASKGSVKLILQDAEGAVQTIGVLRDVFNGFTIEDVVAIAGAFRYPTVSAA